ncbi:hypothetical protein WA026_019745 [Henosepilachna vigintioctopunctata]|uniref:Peroxisomal membrane protein 11C n=1 Tax=Henosepilachna vigintioctopunctata TaxID=420089 RepID=A0AAW1UQG7_9CUCU
MDFKFVLNEICAVLETYRGRDKILRTLCYSLKLVGGLTGNELLGDKLIYISKHLSDTRATLRLLDDIPMLKFSLDYGLGKKEDSKFLSYVGVLCNLIDHIYYPIEKIAWLAEHKLITKVNSSKWDTACTICWLLSIYLSLFRSLRHLCHLEKHLAELESKNNSIEDIKEFKRKEIYEFITITRLFLDLIHATSSFPRGRLFPFELTTWQVGLIGSTSSILGLYQIFTKRHM